MEDCILVSFVGHTDTDKDLLVVGRQSSGKIDILNAVMGQEAADLYHSLLRIRKKARYNAEV